MRPYIWNASSMLCQRNSWRKLLIIKAIKLPQCWQLIVGILGSLWACTSPGLHGLQSDMTYGLSLGAWATDREWD